MNKKGTEQEKKLELDKETLRLLTAGNELGQGMAISIGCTIRTY